MEGKNTLLKNYHSYHIISISPFRIKQKNRIKPFRLFAHSTTHKTRQTMTDTNACSPFCGLTR